MCQSLIYCWGAVDACPAPVAPEAGGAAPVAPEMGGDAPSGTTTRELGEQMENEMWEAAFGPSSGKAGEKQVALYRLPGLVLDSDDEEEGGALSENPPGMIDSATEGEGGVAPPEGLHPRRLHLSGNRLVI